MAAAVNAADVASASDAVPSASSGKIGNDELDQSLKDWEDLSAEYSVSLDFLCVL